MLLKYNEQTRAGTTFTVAILANLVFQFLFSFVLAGAGVDSLTKPENFAWFIAAQVLLPVVTLGSVWFFLRSKRRYVQKTVWNWRKPKLFDALVSVGLGIAVCFSCGFINELFVRLFGAMGLNTDMPFPSAKDPGQLVAFLVVLCALPAFSEEMIFRGGMLSFSSGTSTWKYCLSTAFFFMIMHMNILQMPNALLVGFVMALVVAKTGSIFCGIIVHFVNNAVTVFADYFPSKIPELFWGFTWLDVTMAALGALFVAFVVWHYWKEDTRIGVGYPDGVQSLRPGKTLDGLVYALPGLLVALIMTVVSMFS